MKHKMKQAFVLAILWVVPTVALPAWQWEVHNEGQIIFACSPESAADPKLKPPYQNLMSELCFSCANMVEGQSFSSWIRFTDTYLDSDKATVWFGGNRTVEIDLNRFDDDPPEKGKQMFILHDRQTSLLMREISAGAARKIMLEVSWRTSWLAALFGGTSVYFDYPMKNYDSAMHRAKNWCGVQPKLGS